MATHLPPARHEVMKLMVRIANGLHEQSPNWPKEEIWRRMGAYLSRNYVCISRMTHSRIKTNSRKAAGTMLASIWRKWDIVNDRPLPEGVERIWREHDRKSEVVWKKNGSPYYASVSNSSV
jgi:hypothetical protein